MTLYHLGYHCQDYYEGVVRKHLGTFKTEAERATAQAKLVATKDFNGDFDNYESEFGEFTGDAEYLSKR